jgi:hypothetical protein
MQNALGSTESRAFIVSDQRQVRVAGSQRRPWSFMVRGRWIVAFLATYQLRVASKPEPPYAHADTHPVLCLNSARGRDTSARAETVAKNPARTTPLKIRPAAS